MRLPPELVSSIFTWLEEEDLATACIAGECCLEERARLELARRGLWHYQEELRSPLPRRKTQGLVVTGNSLPGSLPQGVKKIGIYLQKPQKLNSEHLKNLLSLDVTDLKIKNAVLNAKTCETILNTDIIRLNLTDGCLSKRAFQLLYEYKELFDVFIIRLNSHLKILSATPEDLRTLNFRGIRKLSLYDGSFLTDYQLFQISQLHLEHFTAKQITQVTIEGFNESFSIGFDNLKYLNLIETENIDSKTCHYISTKSKIHKVKIDLRHTLNFIKCIKNLLFSYSLQSVVFLYSDQNCVLEKIKLELLEFKSLKSLILRNYAHIYRKEEPFKDLKDKLKNLNINFEYINCRTLESTSLGHYEKSKHFRTF